MDLVLQNLRKHYGDKLAVEIPSLTIHSGEFFTFVGPSGCGKSTTLNLIAGLEAPHAGTIQLGEQVLNELPPHKRNVAFVFQSYALYPHRTVRGNLSFPLELAGWPRGDVRTRVAEVAALLGMTPLLDRRPSQLSGGERQRVALGRAIVRRPRLFLFDEPLSNLDAPLRAQMRKELRHLHGQLGTTFVYVTHDQEEALSLSQRIAVMRGGTIQQVGTPRELYDRPANPFVASFFGAPPMNLFPAELESADGGLWIRAGNARFPLKAMPVARPSRRVLCGIRPEDVALTRESAGVSTRAKVISAELHGGQCHVELDLEGLRLTAAARPDAVPAAGTEMNVAVSSERWHVFELESEKRLAP